MPGVQTILPVMLNHLNNNKITLEQIVNFMCENPVKIFGIKNKGFIKKNYDADITIVDLNKNIEIKNDKIESKCKWSPFNNYIFRGCPTCTIVNGEIKMKDGEIIGDPKGRPIIFD